MKNSIKVKLPKHSPEFVQALKDNTLIRRIQERIDEGLPAFPPDPEQLRRDLKKAVRSEPKRRR